MSRLTAGLSVAFGEEKVGANACARYVAAAGFLPCVCYKNDVIAALCLAPGEASTKKGGYPGKLVCVHWCIRTVCRSGRDFVV